MSIYKDGILLLEKAQFKTITYNGGIPLGNKTSRHVKNLPGQRVSRETARNIKEWEYKQAVREYEQKNAPSYARGRTSEQRFFDAFWSIITPIYLPLWFYGIRVSTSDEDLRQGIDFVIETSVGPVPVQIKSSMRSKLDFEEKRGFEIPVIIIRDCYDEEDIRDTTFKILCRKWPPLQSRLNYKCILRTTDSLPKR